MQRLRVCLNDIQFKSLPVALKIMTLNTVFDLSFISFTKFTSCLTIVDGSNRNCVWLDFNLKNYCDRSWQGMFDLSFIPNICQLLHDCWWLQYLRICLIESLLVALKKRWSRQVVFDLTLSLKVSGLAPMLVFPYFFLHYLRTVINYMSVQMLRNKLL